MAPNETFCLHLNKFEEVIKLSWQELQRDNDLCDITLACEDRQIRTHKFVISAFSPVLRNILKLHQNPHPLIYLRKVKYINLQNLITFMYQGEVDVTKEDLPSFLEAAEDLNIRGLSEANTEGINSTRELPLESSPQNIAPYSKRKRIVEKFERSRKVKVGDDNSFVESESENFIYNDSKNIDNPSTELELVKKNIVSIIKDKPRQASQIFKNLLQQFMYNRSLDLIVN